MDRTLPLDTSCVGGSEQIQGRIGVVSGRPCGILFFDFKVTLVVVHVDLWIFVDWIVCTSLCRVEDWDPAGSRRNFQLP